MVEKNAMFFRAKKFYVSGFADTPLTFRLRSADIDADAAADVRHLQSPASPLFSWGDYVSMGYSKTPPKNG